MKFSTVVLTMYLDCEDQPEDDERILDQAIDQSLTAAGLGINPFYTEHHFRGPWHSSPLHLASYLAPRLPEVCYLGFAVLSTPFYHPVRLVEGMNMLDHLTKGHAVFGLGSGFPGLEPAAMGLTAEHHGSSRASDEALEAMRRLWDYKNGDPPFTIETERYRGRIVKRPVPSPYRKHHPHIIVTGRRPDALTRAAAFGWPVFAGTGNQKDDGPLLAQLRTYRQTLAGAGHPREVIDNCMQWCTYDLHGVVVADSDEEAEAAAAQAQQERDDFRALFEERNSRLAGGLAIDEELGAADAGAQRGRQPRTMGGGLAGSPDTIASRIEQLAGYGINHILVRFLGEWTGSTQGVARKSMALFASEVMPRFAHIAPLADPLAVDLVAAA